MQNFYIRNILHSLTKYRYYPAPPNVLFNVLYLLIFQVITGGHYDVDLEIVAPNGQMLYKNTKKQYDTFVWKTDQAGVFKFCFSNEFSTFSHKVVYFDFQVGEEPPLTKNMESHATALTLVSKNIEFLLFC